VKEKAASISLLQEKKGGKEEEHSLNIADRKGIDYALLATFVAFQREERPTLAAEKKGGGISLPFIIPMARGKREDTARILPVSN